jgi:hypothetical protein
MRQRSAEKSLTNAIIRKPRRRLPLLAVLRSANRPAENPLIGEERKWSVHGHDGGGMEKRALKEAPRKCGAFAFYLRAPDALIVGAAPGTPIGSKVLPKVLPAAGALGRGAAGPVFLHVGTTVVEPTVAGYEPTEGATTDPYPAVPSACANANVLVRVKAVASAIVVTFMRCPRCRWIEDNRTVCSTVPLKFLLSATEAAGLFTSRRARDVPAIVVHGASFRLRRCSIATGHNQSGSQLFPTMVQAFP